MLLFPTFTPRFKSSSVPMVFCAALSLLFCGAENGLASQRVRGYSLVKYVRSGDNYVRGSTYYHYIIDGSTDSTSAFYEWWPFLSGLKTSYTIANSRLIWYSPDYPEPGYGRDPPFYYETIVGAFFTASNVPNDWTQDDVNNLANIPVSNLSPSQLSAITGTFVGSNVTNGDTTSKVVSMNTKTPGTVVQDGGVVTYDLNGVPEVSYSDGYGVISGNRLLPDGSTTPIYYTVVDGQSQEHTTYPITDFSNLQTDDQGNYTLSVPDYSGQLNQIITRIDNIDLHVPDINVNPEVNVTVPAPEVTVELPDTISDSLTSIEGSLSTIVSNTSVTGSVSSAENFADLEMSSEEQSLVQDLVSWETNIPLIGEAVDFGLTAIMGKIPSVGTEYVWLDYTIGGGSSAGASGRRGLASFSNPLSGYRVLVSLANYQDLLQATRGTFILFEALYFVILIFKLIHKALLV